MTNIEIINFPGEESSAIKKAVQECLSQLGLGAEIVITVIPPSAAKILAKSGEAMVSCLVLMGYSEQEVAYFQSDLEVIAKEASDGFKNYGVVDVVVVPGVIVDNACSSFLRIVNYDETLRTFFRSKIMWKKLEINIEFFPMMDPFYFYSKGPIIVICDYHRDRAKEIEDCLQKLLPGVNIRQAPGDVFYKASDVAGR